MEFSEVIKNRRSVRKFLETDVEEEKIYQLLEAARLSPSAKNRQPWRFGILKGEKKNEIARLMLEWCGKQNFINEEQRPEYKSSVAGTAEVIRQAPVLILVFREPSEYWHTGDLLSIGSAIEHICLCTTDIGLGSLWIRDTVYVQNEILELTNCKHLELVSVIAVGYAGESLFPRPRKKIEDLLLFK